MTRSDDMVTPSRLVEGVASDVRDVRQGVDKSLRFSENLPKNGRTYLQGQRDALRWVEDKLDQLAGYELMNEPIKPQDGDFTEEAEQ